MSTHPQLPALVAEIRRTPKYAPVCDALIARLGATELDKRRTFKDAVQETRNKLHQVAGLYQDGRMRYAEWLDALNAEAGDRMPLLRRILSHHASTRERLTILDGFYSTVLAGLPPARSVLEIACGLNPLSIPWMPLAPGARYHAVDVYEDMMAFLQSALPLFGVDACCEARDVVYDVPGGEYDLALVLKTLPCLEQTDKDASRRLLDTIRARHIVVSYPTRSVGGREVGMAQTYAGRFEALTAGQGWRVTRFEFGNELVFRLDA